MRQLLDRVHHLELAKAQVTAVDLTPSRPVVAEDVRDLQGLPAHAGPALCRRSLRRQGQLIEGAQHRAQHVGGNVGIAGCRVQFGMAQQHLDHPHVDIALQQMRGERVPLIPSSELCRSTCGVTSCEIRARSATRLTIFCA